MKRVATELIRLARLMEALDLPFRLDPVLPRLLFILFEPDLSQISMGTAQRDGEKVRRWIKVRSAYGADRAERFTELMARADQGAYARIDDQSEIEAFVRRSSSVLGDAIK